MTWTYNGLLHKATIGNGLLALIVLPADLQRPQDDLWVVQINGATPYKPKMEPTSLENAKLTALSYADKFCQSMITECRWVAESETP